MIKKYIFKKKSKFKYVLPILIISLTLIGSYFYKFGRENLFVIPSLESNFYIIPKDRGGKKIPNTDKKSLHLNQKISKIYHLDDSSNLFYSIQFFVSSKYEEVKSTINYYINYHENIYKKEDFYVVAFTSELGIDYFLLYKNFNTREEAHDYCSKYVFHIDKCLIINAQNFL